MSMRTISGMGLASKTYPPPECSGGAKDWVRPSDWLPMPATAANQIDVLTAVFDHESNFCSLKITLASGTYDVDWGDGTSDLAVTSGVKVDHLYDFADTDLDGTLTSEGFKQAMIKITPSSGAGAITRFQFGEKSTAATLVSWVANPWLDVQCNTPGVTTLAYAFYTGTQGATCTLIERINLIALGDITSLTFAFRECDGLVSVTFPAGSFVNVTTLADTFNGCHSLVSIDWPVGSLSLVNSLLNTFNSCFSLRSITWPVGSLSLVTTLQNTFNSCHSLVSIDWPVGSLSLVNSLAGTYEACYSLQKVDHPVGSLSLVTTMASAFRLSMIVTIEFPAGSLTNVTTLQNAFSGCTNLQSLTFPVGSLSSVSNTITMFATSRSLSNITNCLIPVSFSVASSKLSGAALDEIYTALPTVVGQTITVTGNYGTATHTPTIATAKGWAVTT